MKKQEETMVPIKGLTTLACFVDGYQVELRKGYILKVEKRIADMLIGRGYAVRTDQPEATPAPLRNQVGDKVLETRLQIAASQWKGKLKPEKYLILYPQGPKANQARNIISLEREVARKTEA
jgi:hypothetical protein